MAARQVLRAMLPADQLVIRGAAKSREVLRAASGLAEGDAAFDRLLSVLDRDLRLVTPTEVFVPEGESESSAGVRGERFQLTHDFLVPAIHTWLTRRQRETQRGRTELLLSERAGTWSLRPTSGNLPSLREWIWIRCLVPAKQWSRDERRVMAAAGRFHLRRWGVSGLAVLLFWGSWSWNQRRLSQQSLLQRMVAEVDALRDVRGTELTRAVAELTDGRYPEALLRERLIGESGRESEAGRRLPLALASAAMGVDETEFLAGQVLNPLLPDSSVLVAALRDRRERALERIQQRMSRPGGGLGLSERARLALLAMQLGDSSWSESMCRTAVADPIERVSWIREVSQWGGFGRGEGELGLGGSSDLNAALMLALKSAIGVRMTRESAERLRGRVQMLERSGDAGEHAAAVRLLEAWRRTEGEESVDLRSDVALVREANWRVVDGLTLVRVPSDLSGGERAEGSVWICDREVTQGLFQRFMDDAGTAADQKPQMWEGPDLSVGEGVDHPVQQVSRTDAVWFCNWLSRRSGMSECYERVTSAAGATEWRLRRGVSGFRLPMEAEWERACRWGTTTAFHCSDDESFLADYARISSATTLPAGSLLPNGGGLYDMHGNVMEWCEPSEPSADGEYPLRGGAYLTGPADSEAGFSQRFPGDDRYDLAGFRVVLDQGEPDR